jgi:hypothetical protein
LWLVRISWAILGAVTDLAKTDLPTAVDLVVFTWNAIHVGGTDEDRQQVIGDLFGAAGQYPAKPSGSVAYLNGFAVPHRVRLA